MVASSSSMSRSSGAVMPQTVSWPCKAHASLAESRAARGEGDERVVASV